MESLGKDAQEPAVEGGSLTHVVMAAQSTNMSPAITHHQYRLAYVAHHFPACLFCPTVIHQILRLLLCMPAASVC